MWDTAGQERFRSLIPGYLKDCMAALIVFDLSSKDAKMQTLLRSTTRPTGSRWCVTSEVCVPRCS